VGCCVLPVNYIPSFSGDAQEVGETEAGSTLLLDIAVDTAPLDQQRQIHTLPKDCLYDHSAGAAEVYSNPSLSSSMT